MKIKLGKKGNEYYASLHSGKGGISSLYVERRSKSLWFVLGVFGPKLLWHSFKLYRGRAKLKSN